MGNYRLGVFGVFCDLVLTMGATGCLGSSAGIKMKSSNQDAMSTTTFSQHTPPPSSHVPPSSSPSPSPSPSPISSSTSASYPVGSYFVDAVNGNDANDGRSPATAWRTISKVNGFQLSPGNSVLFKRGQTFYGSLTVNQSGASGSPITFGAYGTDSARPVISGFRTLSNWTATASGTFESTCIGCESATKVVTVDGADTPMGRWPNRDAANGGYRTVTSHEGTTSISDSPMPAGMNWTGGEAVIRKYRWVLDRQTIDSQSGNKLSYTSTSPYSAIDGFGYFIQNHPGTLDQFGEWYYSPSTGKLRMFFGANSPTQYAVRVSSVENLFTIVYRNYITISDLAFEGASKSAIYLGSANGITVRNCEFQLSYDGILGDNWGSSSSGFVLQDSKFDHMNNFGVRLPSEFVGAVVKNNTIQNTGLIPGMGDAYTALVSGGPNSMIDGNRIENTGYVGIDFTGSGVTVRNNFVNVFCSVKDDGGGIYTGNPSPRTITGDLIEGNIVLNGVGAGMGTDSPSYSSTLGIYLDDNSNGITVSNNTTAKMGIAGIYLHNAYNVTVVSNTVLDNARTSLLVKNDDPATAISGLKISDNVFFATSAAEHAAEFITLHSDIRNFGVMNNNVYARPIDDNLVIAIQPLGELGKATNLSLSGWQAYSGQDQNSRKSPKSITRTDAYLFRYNATDSSVSVPLSQNYLGFDDKNYSGIFSLLPHASVILLNN